MSMPPPPQQPQGPPPGFPPPPGYAGQPTQLIAQQPQPRSKALQPVWALGLVSVLAVILGLSLDEDGRNQWDTVHAWGGLAIAGALLTLAPAAGRSVGLTRQRAWQVAACGAAALVLFWVLFTLPSVGSNLSLLTTIGVAAGVIAAWVAPGREQQPGQQRQTW
jgi:hypothetical protein